MNVLFKKILVFTLFFGGLCFFWISNYLYATDEQKINSVKLTNDMILEESYRNKVIYYIGIVNGVYKTKEGIINIYFKDANFAKRITATIFPNLGKIPTINKNDEIKVTGYITIYKDKVQINPLNKNMIEILKNEKDRCKNSINFKDIYDNLGKTIFLSNVKILNFNIFKSKSGKKHIKLKLYKEGYFYDAIIFQGFYNSNINSILKVNNKLDCIKVKVSEYKGDISLIIKQIY